MFALRIGIVVIVLAIIGGVTWRQYQQYALSTLLSRQLQNNIEIKIPSGASLRDIANLTIDAGAPINTAEFILLSQHLSIARKLQAGRYQFTTGATLNELLLAFAEGKIISAERLTIVEGTTVNELLTALRDDKRLLSKHSDLDEKTILRMLGDEQYASLEGLLLPETYFFDIERSSNWDIITRARRDMKNLLQAMWRQRAPNDIIKTPYDALILASIVEKETGAAKERPLIASVFINRLKKGIPLQADPTVIYGLGDSFDGNLKRAHLRDKNNLYNTYAHRGLPPTPIALPGKAAIAAVLNPPDTAYYYFVATGDGEHVFSRTLREHNNAVNKYQRKR